MARQYGENYAKVSDIKRYSVNDHICERESYPLRCQRNSGEARSVLTTETAYTIDDVSACHASADEFAVAILLRVFSMAAPVLCEQVVEGLKRHYGEKRWLFVAAESAGTQLRPHVEKDPSTLGRDIYALTEILLNNLDRVFLTKAQDSDDVEFSGVILQRMAEELDCVQMTRTALFHSTPLSAREVERCLHFLECLWTRIGLPATSGFSKES